MKKTNVVILDGVRTAVGSFGKSLSTISPKDLAATTVKEVIRRANIPLDDIGHCVFGNVIHTEPADMYISRYASLQGGLLHQTPALTVNRLCGSGLQAIISATQQIELKQCAAAIAGGAEVMSRGGHLSPNTRFGKKIGNSTMIDMMLGALTCPFEKYHMGITAENIAKKWNISREEQDEFALLSHQKASRSQKNGKFASQIIPINIKNSKTSFQFKQDEHIRHEATKNNLSQLQPAFEKNGTVTAGNSSGLNDGAGAIMLMDEEKCLLEGLKPRARIVCYSTSGVDPKYMGIGPVLATKKIFDETGLSADDIDVFEINEAFAAQAIAVARDLKIPLEKLNPNGGGIALGHPIGATGCILVIKAINELEQCDGQYALISMCIGGGQGISILIEKV